MITTTELIKLLQDNEKGGISHKPRVISLTVNGRYLPEPQITLSSTGDGICGPEIDFDVDGEWYEPDPCDDAISREEMLKYQWYLHGKMSNEENHKLWQFIKSLPSVTPKQKTGEWIELKDQKPEEFEDVLVKDIDGDVTCAYLCNDGHFLERFSGIIIGAVVEWMEIP